MAGPSPEKGPCFGNRASGLVWGIAQAATLRGFGGFGGDGMGE